jgi:hypothetical protein
MKSWKRLAGVGLTAALLPAAMLVGVMACGPDFEPEVFISANRPEAPARFADGHLGILQNGYYHAELVVAYRYLTGGRLGDGEKAAYTSPPSMDSYEKQYGDSSASGGWMKARRAAMPGAAGNGDSYFSQEREFEKTANGYAERSFELNCPDAAFTTATATLESRTKTWGAQSTELAEWVRGQDAVFSNCSKAGTMPDATQSGWSAALKRDRAYQIAAAKFYEADFDGAMQDFEAIGRDKASPWSRWGAYLAARAEVRKAASTAKAADYTRLANFDRDGLKEAQRRLLAVERESNDVEVRHAAEAERGFVEVRLDPAKRLDAASKALMGPVPDADFQSDLMDLDFLMDHGVSGDTDLVRWIEEMQSPWKAKPKARTPQNATSVWQERPTMPWLIAALSEAHSEDAAGGKLLAAAVEVKRDSPAYATVNARRIGLMLTVGKRAEARTLTDTTLAALGPDISVSTRNELLGLRMPTARTLTEFLADAPRTVISSESSAAEMAQCVGPHNSETNGCTGKISPAQFDADAAGYLNTQMPLALLQEAAQSTALPKHLRDAVAEVAWVRALGLGDSDSVERMAKLLPGQLRQTAGVSDGFPATLALLRSSGLRPYLEQGVQRSASYSELDHYRDNWWCGRWEDGSQVTGGTQVYGPQQVSLQEIGFVTAEQRKQASDEAARLNALPAGLVWAAQRAMAYVKAHPDHKDAPEALALIVQGTRYGCDLGDKGTPQRTVSKDAFDMLHRMYPKSTWTAKTKYYY